MASDEVERTCGTCRYADTESSGMGDAWCVCAAPAVTVGPNEVYPFRYKHVPLDERCKGWQAREGEGGTR